jgi:hypothetical protein
VRPDSSKEVVLFIDRCLGRIAVATALRAAGARVETHDAHFDITCDDDEWLPRVGAFGWVVLTKDKYIRRRPKERRALEDAKVAAFVLTANRVNAKEMADAFVAALPRIRQVAAKYTRPLIATVSRTGLIAVLLGERRGGLHK